MKKFRNRILSVLLAIVMCMSLLPVNAFAAELDETDPTVGDTTVTDVPEEENGEEPDTPEGEDGENETEEDPQDTGDGDWDLAQTQRPPASDGVTAEPGSDGDKDDPYKDWTVFYDADNDVYKVTFNIGAGAEDPTQVIDLTQALEILGQYAESGRQELQAAISNLERPEAPGKPEGLDENVASAYETIIDDVPRSEEGEPAGNYDYAGAIAEATGLSKDDPYVQAMASYLYDQATVDWCMSNWATWKAEGHWYCEYFGDPDTFLHYGCGITVKWPDGYNQGIPVLEQAEPEFEVDKTSDAYKAYLDAMIKYDADVAQLQAYYDRQIGANVLEPGDVRRLKECHSGKNLKASKKLVFSRVCGWMAPSY